LWSTGGERLNTGQLRLKGKKRKIISKVCLKGVGAASSRKGEVGIEESGATTLGRIRKKKVKGGHRHSHQPEDKKESPDEKQREGALATKGGYCSVRIWA